MKISYNWLKEYIKTDLSADQIADILTLTGLEVEEVIQIGSGFDNIVVGEVLDVKTHENADRLRVCRVDAGTGTDLQIICGAPNVKTGQKVPVAKIGAVLPVKLDDGTNLTIKKAKIRGVSSEGMICAEDELGISSDHAGIMVLDTALKPGTPFSEVHPVYTDIVFEIGLTPNRPDASCHIGTARDIAAVLELPMNTPDTSSARFTGNLGDRIKIRIDNPDKCYRYVGMIVENVNIGPSPDWLQNRLRAIGLRPVNNVVDVTNYVMFEYGQPLHAFDYNLIAGKEIIIRDYDTETKFTTLDGIERNVPAGSVFICDGEKPVAIGGVMGGLNSEIVGNTTTVFIESANFNPVSIRKTSRHLSLQTDSSYRFERGVDPNITRIAAERCAQLIAETSGGTIIEGTNDVYPSEISPLELKLRPSYLERILGTVIDKNTAAGILERLGFSPVISKHKEAIVCKVPTFRPDVTLEIDLVEEVARIFNYNNIPTTGRIAFAKPSALPDDENFETLLKDTMKSLGFQEIYTNSLLPDQFAELMTDDDSLLRTLNPISKDQSVLRPSLGHGFLKTVSYNFNRLNYSVRLFEIGNVFRKTDNGTYHAGINEEPSLLLGVSGIKNYEHWSSAETLYTIHDLKGAIEALARKLRLTFDSRVEDNSLVYTCSGKETGRIFIAEPKTLKLMDIDKPVYYAELNIPVLKKLYYSGSENMYKPVPKYPPFDYDFAIIVEKNKAAGDLEKVTREYAGPLLHSIEVFDIFEGKPLEDNEKSIATRLRFISDTKTLTINEVQPIIENILSNLEKQFNAKLRS